MRFHRGGVGHHLHVSFRKVRRVDQHRDEASELTAKVSSASNPVSRFKLVSRSKFFLASSIRPFRTSNQGDSGARATPVIRKGSHLSSRLGSACMHLASCPVVVCSHPLKGPRQTVRPLGLVVELRLDDSDTDDLTDSPAKVATRSGRGKISGASGAGGSLARTHT